MVRFVSQRPPPEDPLFEILVRRWQSKKGYEKVGKVARPAWWRVNFPVYMELAYLFSNVVFVLGSVLFLPMHQEDEVIHSLGMTLDTVDKNQLLAASTHFQSLVDSMCDLHNVLAAKAPEPDPGAAGGAVSMKAVTTADESSEAASPADDHNASNSSARRPGGVRAPPYDSLGQASEAAPVAGDRNASNSSALLGNHTLTPPSSGEVNDSSKVPTKTEPPHIERRLVLDHQIARPTNPLDGCPLRVEEVQEQIASLGEFSSSAFVVAFEAPQVMAKRQRLDWRVDLGCYFFILGSLVVALLCLYDLLEEILHCYRQGADEEVELLGGETSGQLSPSGAASPTSPMSPTRAQSRPDLQISDYNQACGEKLLYLVGSVVFLVGTLYWQHPEKLSSQLDSMDDQDVIVMAIFMFILGSVVFTFAAFLNALSLTTGMVRFRSWAVATCGLYEFGGILFVMGSVCFMPGCTEKMECLGAWSFIIGSLFYVVGSLFQLSKTTALLYLRLEEEMKEDAAKAIQLWWKGLPKARRVRTRLRQVVTKRMQQERINVHIAKGKGGLVETLHKAIETPQFLDHFNRQTSPRLSGAAGRTRQGSFDSSAPGSAAERSAAASASSRKASKSSFLAPPGREELAEAALGSSRRGSKSSLLAPPGREELAEASRRRSKSGSAAPGLAPVGAAEEPSKRSRSLSKSAPPEPSAPP